MTPPIFSPLAEAIAPLSRTPAALAGTVTASIEAPDLALRRAILEQKALARGVVLDPRLATRLAGAVGGSARRLEGMLTRLLAHARAKNLKKVALVTDNSDLGQLIAKFFKIGPRLFAEEHPGHRPCYDPFTRCSMRCRNCSQSASVILRAGLSSPACNSFSSHDKSGGAAFSSAMSRETASVTNS